jgi:hypothetical protein
MCIKSEEADCWIASRFEIIGFAVLKIKKTLSLDVTKFTG